MNHKAPNFRRNALAHSVLIACSTTVSVLAVQPVLAQDAKLERVTITGSAIKRTISQESALPMTVLSTQELRESGVTSVEEAIKTLSASQSSRGSSQSIGSGTGGKAEADLRGLGANKTLVLLNGRRMASFAFDSSSVDLNAIPLAAIERIEVLRDGASAIYGTDAIGGVINFITKKNYQGMEISVETNHPQHPGGTEERVSAAGGWGDLDKDGYNFWVTLDTHRQASVAATQRDFAKTGVSLDKGLNLTSGTTFPGNFTQVSTGVSGNPTRASGCQPPRSLPLSATTCRYDYTAAIDIVAPTQTDTVTGRGNFKIGENLASLELLHSENKNVARVAPDPVTGITMTSASPYFPSAYPGLDSSNLTVGWRMDPAGLRTNEANSSTDRVVGTLSGTVAEWDYELGAYWTQSKANDGGIDGYVDAGAIKAAVRAGLLNPFGAPTAAQQSIIDAAKMIGTAATAKGETKGVDFKVSRELFNLPAGKVGVSAGFEFRNETYQNDTNDAYVEAVPSMGRDVFHASGSRDIQALTLEALVPVTKQLELQLAARNDHYSDFGNTFNPKIGFRFQPTSSFVLRGSANTGYRAPTLDEIYGPQSMSFAANSYDDPVLCPGGVVNTAAGGIASRDCGMQVQTKIGGNPSLKPETSTTMTVGMVFQPTKNFQMSIDYWKIALKDKIDSFPEAAIMADSVKYASRITRCDTLPLALQDTLAACQAGFNNGPGIAYINTVSENLGKVNTDGFDLSASYSFKTDGLGSFLLSYNGTLVNSYEYQNSPDSAFKQSVGTFQDKFPVFKWQHVLGLNHKLGDWSTQLTVSNKSGYRDQDNGQVPIADVESYTLTNLSTTYTGIKKLSLTAGIKNLFDVEPPFSQQAYVFQKGYDPRYTDAIGRSLFLRATYKF